LVQQFIRDKKENKGTAIKGQARPIEDTGL